MNVKNRVRNGFTLIELLIALAIIAIIAAILFPVFGAVRERGRRTVCGSNLKQLANAMQQYVQDNGGVYPSTPADCGYAPYSYLKNTAVFRCPDHAPDEITEQFSLNPPIMLSANSIVLGAAAPVNYTYDRPRFVVFISPFSPASVIQGVHEASLAAPSTTWFNVDASWTDTDGIAHYFRTVSTSCGRHFEGSTLYAGAGNYSYVDGHVKWLTPEEAGEIECANEPLPAPFKD